jgi:hypothetical protein
MGPPEHPKSPAWSPKSLFSMSSLAPRTNNSLERVSKMLFSNSSTPSSSRFFRASLGAAFLLWSLRAYAHGTSLLFSFIAHEVLELLEV